MNLLLVEDEVKLSEALTVLIGRAGYTVETALDGLTALQMTRENKYDVIVLDRMLPRLDGLSVLKEMRKEKNDTPVLLLTAKDEPSERVAGLEAGADDYLIKPFFTEELLARIKVLTRRSEKKSTENIIESGGITLYPLHGEALLKGKTKIQLTVKETALLSLLMQNQGQVVTKERIMEKIWGYNSDAGIANVDLYIYYLRKKLNLTNIRTIRGIGYSFEEEQ
ncbi:DNA-binding response regulator, OmpR family, contains REC and winged-helix (wHTH) domain [Propionispira arboris]|uniref:DNA-binding response regulator, OmpR family, contains REC and winged-helix (WHTH) domain n=1 Tax=Propionispira arboris TaxID=84035 RepID=A0A1H6X2A9_9FIRM|nr:MULTISPECIES: response regulator transcription factor [Propionispira]SEJ20717.1 DNA-binding response regulator, OmpR family, contains REC and winged-helix (wHTH) domain [Propionispira arboris]